MNDKNVKITVTRRIDLSNCKLLSIYGRNLANGEAVKIGLEPLFIK